MIQIRDLNLTFAGGRKIFDNLNWQIDTGSRTGLVGPNGIGKTTLLRAMVGQVSADSGDINLSPLSATVGYLPQDLAELPDVTLMQYLKDRTGITAAEKKLKRCSEELAAAPASEHIRLMKLHDEAAAAYENLGGYSFEALSRKALRGLGFHDGDDARPCGEFSGGWKMRVTLAALLLSRPDILLLDEPTNHLDTESMEWLENWLSDYRGTLVAISHDRVFMDKIMKCIAELHSGRIRIYKGNFSDYLRASEEQKAQLEQAAARQKEEIARTKEFIERFRYKATKAAQVQSRVKALEKVQIIRTETAARRITLKFPPCPPSGHIVLTLTDLGMAYGTHRVFERLNATVERGQKIALVGVNGAGKSTLSRLISGKERPTSGSCETGYHVLPAFFSQESAENLNYDRTVWQEICPLNMEMSEADKRALLGSFLFSGDDIYKSVKVLSGGEKSRLSLVKILMNPSNFLILDEPTNHLDMTTRELFQQALLAYDGTLLIVSHDRYFLNQLAQRVWELRDGTLHDYAGNYSRFIEQRQASLALNVPAVDPDPKRRGGEREKKREEAQRRNEIYRRKKVYADELAALEGRIDDLENRKAKDERELCRPEVLSDSVEVQALMKDLADAGTEIEAATNRWEELMKIIEKIEKGE
ncbi:ABC-F family ATP-binding cassette domain-containing protein [Pyramidobacter sp. SM-530-WT-4B]|uniref:ABC-F family ATP-binding cassette domain-containing protein n=1 Tax=Pyramidobacter porci TaxID=2605789 RepID=A0A6L5YB11_9BACT|nr:ATP-binding cassette domain-containing protein [Pyramidobacter porci]MDY2649251.1 ATP-binding cassette domain-containing protein [Pyramidobacter porci]MST54732.1 ABC-F family ATP-binding cassette domain-containing protein [Pyramidobacter porci]